MCLFFLTAFLGPRVGIAAWWFAEPARWQAAFGSSVWPVLGAIFAPWTTLMVVAVAPFGSPTGYDWLFILLALVADFAILAGGLLAGPAGTPKREEQPARAGLSAPETEKKRAG